MVHAVSSLSNTRMSRLLTVDRRQDVTAERLHSRVLHASLVRRIPFGPQHRRRSAFHDLPANRRCLKTMCRTWSWTNSSWSSVFGIPQVCCGRVLLLSNILATHARRLRYRSGQEQFDRLRSLSYAETHIVLICFSVRAPMSNVGLSRLMTWPVSGGQSNIISQC